MTSTAIRNLLLALALAASGVAAALAEQAVAFRDVAEARRAMEQARADGARASTRAERLEAEARRVTEAADRTAREAAAVAARIQQSEARIAGLEAQAGLIAGQRAALGRRLAERQLPLVRLTAALQRLSRRPPALALLRPGSVRETMYMRALLESMLPEIERRTAALRQEIARGRLLQARAERAAKDLRSSERDLRERRRSLAALESRQRIESRQAMGLADREAERALALAERAQDLGALASRIGEAGKLRQALAALPGPILRPARPDAAQVVAAEPPRPPATGFSTYILPVSGRLVTGFGSVEEGQARSRGIALAARAGAQIVAPAAGRVAFAGPFRGYGRIVIVEHDGGWTSLLTGLAELDTRVGEDVIGGSPLGRAGPGNPVIGLELRRDGEPVNPLQFIDRP